jgi:D-psicose/D-tagatose/L-ribulose 3-epimerase
MSFNLCVSALAWKPEQENQAFELLRDRAIGFVELIPARAAINTVGLSERLRDLRLAPVSFQALLFGTQNLHLFQSEPQRTAMFDHLAGVCRLAGQLGVKAIVFGSPRNRWIDTDTLSADTAHEIAARFFYALGDVAKQNGTTVCLEPNPVAYGANFLNKTSETADFVKAVNHPAVRLNLDLGAVSMNAESLESLWPQIAEVVGHIHWSEPSLSSLGQSDSNIARALIRLLNAEKKAGKRTRTVSIEMLPAKDEDFSRHISEAVTYAKKLANEVLECP